MAAPEQLDVLIGALNNYLQYVKDDELLRQITMDSLRKRTSTWTPDAPLYAFYVREVSTNFPLLSAHHVVSLWSVFEVFTREMFVGWLMTRPEALANEPFKGIKIQLSTFLMFTERQRFERLVDEATRFSNQPGSPLERFDKLAAAFGTSINLDPEKKRDLIEFYGVRNVIVHRRGIVDARFRELCPWHPVVLGGQIVLSHLDVDRYSKALLHYVQTLFSAVSNSVNITDEEARYMFRKMKLDEEVIASVIAAMETRVVE